ncbi:MAG: 4Fe-4S binding protein [Candidatus Lokiarchaeota archaeon]|nr:4Fe-4S binding protein [Candidatus Lokiarchaeota archaeon]
MENEKLFPISINPNLCLLCQQCMFSCPNKAFFFKNSLQNLNYETCGAV